MPTTQALLFALPAIFSAPTEADVHVRADASKIDATRVAEAIEDTLAAEGISVHSGAVVDGAAGLATVDVIVDEQRVRIRIDDVHSAAAMERDFPSDGEVSTVVAQETAYVVRAAAVSLREHGTLEAPDPQQTASVEPPAPDEPMVAPPSGRPETSASPAKDTPPPARAFPRGGFIETQVGPGGYLVGRDGPLPTLDTAAAAGFEFGPGEYRQHRRIALALAIAHDERFTVPSRWRGGARGPIGLYSQWDFMPRLRLGWVTNRFMPHVSLAMGPGVETNNDSHSDRFMLTATASGGASWQAPMSGVPKLTFGFDLGARGSVDPIHPEVHHLRVFAALLVTVYFGQGK